jgi:predicted enzyme related to lactoylglutathione lyase
MALVHAFQPGMFCWIELTTTDVAAAKAFYHTVLGWTYDEKMAPYFIATVNGHQALGMYDMGDDRRQQGVPPHWLPYVAVANIDEAASNIAALGGRVTMGPRDMPDGARLVWAQDPGGAAFAVFLPSQRPGALVTNEPGAMCWVELVTRDLSDADRFYTSLFGWTTEKMPGSPTGYTIIKSGDVAVAGMVRIPPEDDPNERPLWFGYFQVLDCDATVDKVKAAGGSVLMPPQSVPTVGRFSLVRDPQRAIFGLLQPERQ